MADDPDLYADNYEFQVPIFVVTHHAPPQLPKQNEPLRFTFVTDGVEAAVAQGKAAAGEKDVTLVGGPDGIRQCLQSNLANELQIDIMSVFLGQGLRLFAHSTDPAVELEKIRGLETPTRTSLQFRILKETKT